MVQEADYGITDGAFNGAQGRFKGDENLLVKFFIKPRLMQTESKLAGRPIYKDTPYVQINVPGNKDAVIIRPATQLDRNRFAEHWRKFTAREDQTAAVGTPLAEWPGVGRSQVEELKFFNVQTVEQLISMSDTHSGSIMGFNGLKERAKAWLEASSTNAASQALIDAEERMAVMEATIARLTATEEAMVAEDHDADVIEEAPMLEAAPENGGDPVTQKPARRGRSKSS